MSKIKFSDVSYREVEEDIVLKNITLSIEKGELFMIKGASEIEKKLFLMLAQGLILPTEGEVVVNCTDDEHIGSNIIPFLPDLTVKESLTLPLIIKGYSSIEISKRISEITQYFSIENTLETKIHLLSKEKKALLGVVKAVISEPSIVILDSFSQYLDHRLAVIVMTYLHEIAVDFNITVLIVEDDSRLHPFASKILHLENGYIKDLVGEGVDLQKLMPFLKI